MRPFLKALSRHLLIFIALSLTMLMIVFISGQFTVLHENAYIDGVMSIVYVYAVILIVLFINKGFNHYAAHHPSSRIQKIQAWHKDNGILINIAIGFTLITVVNSAMMISGLDVPKTGSFAYLHLLVRLMIVNAAVMFWKHKAMIHFLRRLFELDAGGTTSVGRSSFKKRVIRLLNHPFEASAALFTIITALGCLGMLGLSLFVNVQGGETLYLALLVLYGLLYTTLKLLIMVFIPRSYKRDSA